MGSVADEDDATGAPFIRLPPFDRSAAHLLVPLQTGEIALAPLVANLDNAVMRLIPSATAPLRLLATMLVPSGTGRCWPRRSSADWLSVTSMI
jgi:hypothetical protein